MFMCEDLSRREFLGVAAVTGIAAIAGHTSHQQTQADDDSRVGMISVPERAAGPILFAARELQKYAERLSTRRWKIVLDTTAVGRPAIILSSATSPHARVRELLPQEQLPAVGTDAYRLRGDEATLLIAGGGDRAVLFGVYDLLERAGCRWFGPLEEFIPPDGSFTLPTIDERTEPGMLWRGLELIAGSDPSIVDWMAKARLNVAWPEKYTPQKDLTVSPDNLKAAAVPEMIERGLTIFWGGHILPILFSAERYADHPEYFAQIQGKRLDPQLADVQARWQLCTSNPDAVRILIENTVTFLTHHPWIDVLFFWTNDTTGWCECEDCRRLEPEPDRKSPFGGLNRSISYCRLVKLLSEGVEKTLPGRRIAFNHFYNLEDLPADLSVLPSRRTLSAVDVYRQCPRHRLNDPRCPAGKQIEPLVRVWGSHFEDTISWTYYWSWNFMKGLPFARTRKIAADLQFMHSLGIRGNVDNVTLTPANAELYDSRPGLFLSEQWRYNLLDFMIYARASWNLQLNVQETVADFLRHYYGPAAKPMARFWEQLETTIAQFGSDPAALPEDHHLSEPNAIHGWLKNIRGLIPNRLVWEALETHLREARHLAASAYKEPLKPQYMPYVERVQLLERALSVWSSTTPDAVYPRN